MEAAHVSVFDLPFLVSAPSAWALREVLLLLLLVVVVVVVRLLDTTLLVCVDIGVVRPSRYRLSSLLRAGGRTRLVRIVVGVSCTSSNRTQRFPVPLQKEQKEYVVLDIYKI